KQTDAAKDPVVCWWQPAHRPGSVVQPLSSLPTSERVKDAPMYLKCGRTFKPTRYHPGSPSTSETVISAWRSGRRLRTPGAGLSMSATYWRIQLFNSASRSLRDRTSVV